MMMHRHQRSQPFGPVKKGGRASEYQENHQQDASGIHIGLQRRPLGNQHAEGGEEHARDTDDHHIGEPWQLHDQPVHILHVPAAGAVFHRAHGKEHQRLGHRMEHHQKDARPHGLMHAHARAGRNQSQI